MENKHFHINGEKKQYDELPMTIGDYTIYQTINTPTKKVYVVDLDGLEFKFNFYKWMLSITTDGHESLEGAVGVLGQYPNGKKISRDGLELATLEELAFDWQVQPGVDLPIFHFERSPQLPYEVCRMPTAARPNRRMLRANRVLFEQASNACESKKDNENDYDLCIGDVIATGDVGMADAW